MLTAIIWGGTFIAGKVVVQSMEPFSAAFCRFAIASLCLRLLTKKIEGKLPPLKWQQIPLVTIRPLAKVMRSLKAGADASSCRVGLGR